MSPGNPACLLKLADREFRQLAELRPLPSRPRKLKPLRLNATRFDQSWDRKRGAATRLTAVLMREHDAALERHVCESERSMRTCSHAADWLQRESTYLRKMARLLDQAGESLSIVLTRCQPGKSP